MQRTQGVHQAHVAESTIKEISKILDPRIFRSQRVNSKIKGSFKSEKNIQVLQHQKILGKQTTMIANKMPILNPDRVFNSAYTISKRVQMGSKSFSKDFSPINAIKSLSKQSLGQSSMSSSHVPTPLNKFKINRYNQYTAKPKSIIYLETKRAISKDSSYIDRSLHRSTLQESRLEQFDGIESY